MSTILQPLIERLRAEGPSNWERIAKESGVAASLPRKLVYGDRDNPTVKTIQPLFDYFSKRPTGKQKRGNSADGGTE